MDTRNYDVIDPDFSQPDYLPPCNGDACRPCPPMFPPARPLPPCRPPKPGCTSNSTPWYGLPQWAAGDVTSWLMQMNGAMMRIDTIMHDLALRTGINGLPDDLVSCVAKVSQDVEVIKCTVGELSNKQANVDLLMQNINTQFSAMKTDVASLTLSVTNLDTRIMTVDSKADGMKNDIVLLKTDLNMLSKTVQNLTANFTSFQNSVNQSIAELQTQANNLIPVITLEERVKNKENWVINTGSSVYEFTDSFDPSTAALSVLNAGNVGIIALTTPFNLSVHCIASTKPEVGNRMIEFGINLEGADLPNEQQMLSTRDSIHMMCRFDSLNWHPVNATVIYNTNLHKIVLRVYLGDYAQYAEAYDANPSMVVQLVSTTYHLFGKGW